MRGWGKGRCAKVGRGTGVDSGDGEANRSDVGASTTGDALSLETALALLAVRSFFDVGKSGNDVRPRLLALPP